jgi:hypothetical protein
MDADVVKRFFEIWRRRLSTKEQFYAVLDLLAAINAQVLSSPYE